MQHAATAPRNRTVPAAIELAFPRCPEYEKSDDLYAGLGVFAVFVRMIEKRPNFELFFEDLFVDLRRQPETRRSGVVYLCVSDLEFTKAHWYPTNWLFRSFEQDCGNAMCKYDPPVHLSPGTLLFFHRRGVYSRRQS